jgi:hypothetical protein
MSCGVSRRGPTRERAEATIRMTRSDRLGDRNLHDRPDVVKEMDQYLTDAC